MPLLRLHLRATALLFLAASAVSLFVYAEQQPTASADKPRYSANGELLRPDNYREWIWLSSGLGMSYGPNTAAATANDNPPFDNVFVAPAAYRAFKETGQWPDKTMFVLELRSSESKGSINKGGRFQSGLRAIEVEVKDEQRFPGKWAFFGFNNGGTQNSAPMIPKTQSCYSCHATNGAVDNTFVQFYPTLIEVARQKGTLRTTSE